MISVLKKFALLLLVCLLILLPYTPKAFAQNDQSTNTQPGLQNIRQFISVSALAFSPDSKYLITGDTFGSISLWDIENNKKVYTLPHSFLFFGPHSGEVSSVAFSPDGEFFATGGTDKTAKIWRTDTGELVQDNKGFSDTIKSLAFHSNKEILVTEFNNTNLKVLNLTNSVISTKYPENYAASYGSLSINGNSNTFWSCSREGVIRFWDVDTSKLVQTITLNDYNSHSALEYVDEVLFEPESQVVAFLGKHRVLKRSSIDTLNLANGSWNDLGQPSRIITAFAINASDTLLAVAGYYANTDSDKTFGNKISVQQFDSNGGQSYKYEFPPNSPLVDFLALSPSGEVLVSRGANRITTVWHLPS